MPGGPFIQLGDAQRAPVLDYSVPDVTRYHGSHYLALDLDPSIFKQAAAPAPAAPGAGNGNVTLDIVLNDRRGVLAPRPGSPQNEALRRLLAGRVGSAPAPASAPAAGHAVAGAPRASVAASLVAPRPATLRNGPSIPRLSDLSPEDLVARIQEGHRLRVFRTLWGDFGYRLEPASTKPPRPRLAIIEKYQLSSFLGNYGAGRTVKTFSLLPGERTRISVKTYRRTEETAKDASSVLDSFTKESADDFETSVQNEQSEKQTSSEAFEYNVSAEAEASWGWGSASASGSASGDSKAAREEFAKNVLNATTKQSQRASAKRDVEVNTSFERTESEGEETAIERELENINVSRTLNFVFRQMNQEFVSILHLVDVRVAFLDGDPARYREAPLSKLDDLLDEVVKPDQASRAKARKEVLDQLRVILDHEDNPVNDFVQDQPFLRVNRRKTTTIDRWTVSGVVTGVTRNVLRTDGLVVDAFLGHGEALDAYSKGLQDEAVAAKREENALLRARVEREALARALVAAKDERGAQVFATVFARDGHRENGVVPHVIEVREKASQNAPQEPPQKARSEG